MNRNVLSFNGLRVHRHSYMWNFVVLKPEIPGKLCQCHGYWGPAILRIKAINSHGIAYVKYIQVCVFHTKKHFKHPRQKHFYMYLKMIQREKPVTTCNL